MPYGLELAIAQATESAWSGGYLHLTGYGTLLTPDDVLDHIEEWVELGHAGHIPWETPGPVDVVGIILDDSHSGRPLVTYTPRFLPDGYFNGFFSFDPPAPRADVEAFLRRHAETPDLRAPSRLWIDVDGLINKVHDYTGHDLVNARVQALGE